MRLLLTALLSFSLLSCSNETVMPSEQQLAVPEFDNIPDHSYDEAGGEIIWAEGAVKMIEDGAYPQFTLHIDLEGQSNTTVFKLIAEGAELNGTDLGALDGKSVEIEYIIKEVNELMGIGPKGFIKFEDIESPGNWFLAEGVLEGATEETTSDLPDRLVIWENGAAIEFDYFIDAELVLLNETTVTAWFMAETVNELSYLKVIE